MKSPILRALALTLSILALTLSFAACDGGSADGYVFRANGVDIVIGAPADDIIKALGTPSKTNSSASCGGFDGLDYDYTYKGFRVSTTPAANGQIIAKVVLTDDSVKTPEGLYIGMTRADAEAAMAGKGTPDSVGDNLVYVKGNVKLQVVFRGDSISGISYVAQ